MNILDKSLSLRNIIMLVVIVLVLLIAFNIVDILLMLFAAYVITCAINPLILKLQKYMPRWLAVSILLIAMLLIVSGIFVPLCVMAIKQAVLFFQNFPNYIDGIKDIFAFKVFGFSLESIIKIENIKGDASALIGNFLSHSFEITKVIAGSFTTILAIAIMIFYLSFDENHIKNSTIALFPQKYKKRAGDIIDTINLKVGGYFFAQVIAMVAVGLITMVGLFLIGQKDALLLGFLTFVLDIIPVIGPAIAVTICLISASSTGFLGVILTLVVCILAQWTQNQVLRPIVFGKLMNMHPLMIIISLLIGARFLGFAGVILGPAIASVICVLIDELYIKEINSKKV